MRNRLTDIKPIFCHFIPDVLEHGFVYISEEYKSSVHLCACGCGTKTVMPIGNANSEHFWGFFKIERNGEMIVTFHPSVGNWQIPCKSHYNIVNNKIQWY